MANAEWDPAVMESTTVTMLAMRIPVPMLSLRCPRAMLTMPWHDRIQQRRKQGPCPMVSKIDIVCISEQTKTKTVFGTFTIWFWCFLMCFTHIETYPFSGKGCKIWAFTQIVWNHQIQAIPKTFPNSDPHSIPFLYRRQAGWKGKGPNICANIEIN